MNLYVLLNCNAEGTNFLGVFDTLEAAIEAAKDYNKSIVSDIITFFSISEEYKSSIPDQIRSIQGWDLAEVYTQTMNNLTNGRLIWEDPTNYLKEYEDSLNDSN